MRLRLHLVPINNSLDQGAIARRRADRESSSGQAQSFAHAHHTESFHDCGRVKADACILDLEAKEVPIARQFYCDQFGVAVGYGIGQRLLSDAEEAQIEVIRKITERLRFYRHFNMMLLGKCPAKSHQRFGYAQMLQ